MTEDQPGTDQPGTPRRWVKPAVIVIAIVVAVYVLFTWVFPWITEMGLSPAIE